MRFVTDKFRSSTDLVPVEASPEKKVTSARKPKAASAVKAKAATISSTATETEVVSPNRRKPKAIKPVLVVPAIGTQAWYEYNREQSLLQRSKKRIARKKKLEQEETVFAKDIEDSEDERKPKKLKPVDRVRIRNKQTDAAAAVARLKESVYTLCAVKTVM